MRASLQKRERLTWLACRFYFELLSPDLNFTRPTHTPWNELLSKIAPITTVCGQRFLTRKQNLTILQSCLSNWNSRGIATHAHKLNLTEQRVNLKLWSPICMLKPIPSLPLLHQVSIRDRGKKLAEPTCEVKFKKVPCSSSFHDHFPR